MSDKTKLTCPKCDAEFESKKIEEDGFGPSGLSKQKTKCPECRAYIRMQKGR